MMPPEFRAQGPSVIFYFTDGSRATLADGSSGLRGRTLDQIQRIELHPSGGNIYTGKRDDGVDVILLTFALHELPFDVFAALRTQDAKLVGEELVKVATGLVITDKMPTGRIR